MAQAAVSSPTTGLSPAGSSPLLSSSPHFPGILSAQLSQIPSRSLQQSADKKVSQVAADPLQKEADTTVKRNYTSIKEVTNTCLQCRELRGLVNEVLLGREMGGKIRQKIAQCLLESMEKECVRKIRQKRFDIDEIVKMHLRALTDFRFYQSLVLAEIVKLRTIMKNENNTMTELLAKRKRDLEETKPAANLTFHDEMMQQKDIQTLIETLKDLVQVQTQLESANLPFASLERSDDQQQFLIADFKEARLNAIKEDFERISLKNLPKLKTGEFGTFKGQEISELTTRIHAIHGQIKKQLQEAQADLAATQEDLQTYEDTLTDTPDVATLEALEDQFAFDTEFVKKLQEYREMSAEIAALAKLIEIENGTEDLLDGTVRKALLNRRLQELQQFKDRANHIEKLRAAMIHWITSVEEGKEAIAAIHEWAQEALKRFDKEFSKKDECCTPCREEECTPVRQKEESTPASSAIDE